MADESKPTADQIADALQRHPDLALEVLSKLSEGTSTVDGLRALAEGRARAAETEHEQQRLLVETAGAANPDMTLICQTWTERERGWGQRPDGFTLHLSMADRDAYVVGYNAQWNSEPKVPDSYTHADGNPYLVDDDPESRRILVGRKTQPDGDYHDHGLRGPGSIGPEPSAIGPFDGRAWRPHRGDDGKG